MPILKSKKVSDITLEELKSPVLEKIMNHNDRRNNASKMVDAQLEKIKSLQGEIQTKQEDYAVNFKNDTLAEIADLESKLSSLSTMLQLQEKAVQKGFKPLELTSEDRAALEKTFKPFRKKELELTSKLVSQITEIEKTLDGLKVEREDYHKLYAMVFGQMFHATGDQFSAYFLKENQELLNANSKLCELVNHNGFPKGFF